MLIAARTFLLTLQAFEFRSFLQPSTVTESIVHPSPEQIVRVKGQKLHREHFIFKDLFIISFSPLYSYSGQDPYSAGVSSVADKEIR